MTQYFHARGKLLHFKLEGVTGRQKEAEEEGDKSAGIKGLMGGGYHWWERAKWAGDGYSLCQYISLLRPLIDNPGVTLSASPPVPADHMMGVLGGRTSSSSFLHRI